MTHSNRVNCCPGDFYKAAAAAISVTQFVMADKRRLFVLWQNSCWQSKTSWISSPQGSRYFQDLDLIRWQYFRSSENWVQWKPNKGSMKATRARGTINIPPLPTFFTIETSQTRRKGGVANMGWQTWNDEEKDFFSSELEALTLPISAVRSQSENKFR